MQVARGVGGAKVGEAAGSGVEEVAHVFGTHDRLRAVHVLRRDDGLRDAAGEGCHGFVVNRYGVAQAEGDVTGGTSGLGDMRRDLTDATLQEGARLWIERAEGAFEHGA